ncbi:MAG: hypothetical protein AAB483_03740 [Patescibacteria group bacterium]
MKKKTTKQPFLEEYRKGFESDELNRKMDIVLEHVAGMDTRMVGMEKDIKEIKNTVNIMDVKLTGKADTSSVEKIERRVTHLEGAVFPK